MSIFIDTLTSAVTDGIEENCESTGEKIEAIERVIASLQYYAKDLAATAYPAIPDITSERLAELRAALDAEEISYGLLAEIDAAFEQIDPATLSDHPENATAEDKLDELEARVNARSTEHPHDHGYYEEN